MKTLQIMTSRANGGAETYACDVMTRLQEAGVEQCVVMHKDAKRFTELEALGIRMAPAPLGVPFAPAQRFLLRGLIAREQPTIVQTWMRRAASLVSKGRAACNRLVRRLLRAAPLSELRSSRGRDEGHRRDMVKKGIVPDRAHYIPTFPVIAEMPPVDRATLSHAARCEGAFNAVQAARKKRPRHFPSCPERAAWNAMRG